jgi:hypothetical protein
MIPLRNIENLQSIHGAASLIEQRAGQLKRKIARVMSAKSDTLNPTAEQVDNWKTKFHTQAEELNDVVGDITDIWTSVDVVDVSVDE